MWPCAIVHALTGHGLDRLASHNLPQSNPTSPSPILSMREKPYLTMEEEKHFFLHDLTESNLIENDRVTACQERWWGRSVAIGTQANTCGKSLQGWPLRRKTRRALTLKPVSINVSMLTKAWVESRLGYRTRLWHENRSHTKVMTVYILGLRLSKRWTETKKKRLLRKWYLMPRKRLLDTMT